MNIKNLKLTDILPFVTKCFALLTCSYSFIIVLVVVYNSQFLLSENFTTDEVLAGIRLIIKSALHCMVAVISSHYIIKYAMMGNTKKMASVLVLMALAAFIIMFMTTEQNLVLGRIIYGINK